MTTAHTAVIGRGVFLFLVRSSAIRRHRVDLTLGKEPIQGFIKAIAAEMQPNPLRVVSGAVTDMIIKAEILLIVPQVKCLAADIASLERIVHLIGIP